MGQSISIPLRAAAPVQERTAEETGYVPWYIWCSLAGIICAMVGGTWDISFHESVGRDTFWTPAHMFIYAGGILAGVACGYLILSTTFRRDSPLRASSVEMWGFRGPLGAFICAWGGAAMLISAPFDNWWHNAYGLDVKVLSPPHMVLALGLIGLRFGTLMLVLAELGRATGRLYGKLHFLFLYTMATVLGLTVGVFIEMTSRNFMHSGRFYLVVCLVAPLWYAAVTRVSPRRWACTMMVGIYTALHLCFTWILPLFPAEPKLGPVYQHVTHLIPPDFPLLLIVPAIAFDLIRRRFAGSNLWVQAAAGGATFLATFLAVQWPFAYFLISPESHNWVFATNDYAFFIPSTADYVRGAFTHVEGTASVFWLRMFMAFAAATLMMRAGLGLGGWLRRVRR